MNEYIDTREGWREVERAEAAKHGEVLTYRAPRGEEPRVRTWVREAPVPPLPTEEGTVIGIGDWRLVRLAPYEPGLPGTWEMLPIPKAVQSSVEAAGARMQCVYGDEWVQVEVEQHSGFEVLAEPRAVTAEAVIAEAERYFDGAWIPGHERLFSYDHQRALFERLRSKFGVSS